MPRRPSRIADVGFPLLLALAGGFTMPALADPLESAIDYATDLADMPDIDAAGPVDEVPLASIADGGPVPLQLDVSINGAPTGLIGAFEQNEDGTLSVAARELQELGIRAPAGTSSLDAMIRLDQIPGVAYTFDPVTQSIGFRTTDAFRMPRQLSARSRPKSTPDYTQPGLGAVLNYSLFANFQNDEFFSIPYYQGVSGTFDGRIFSRFGTLNQSFTAGSTGDEWFPNSVRLDTTWSYDNPATMLSYRAGDLISGGLTWTRPVRLGGVQVQRDFALRSDLVTIPMPALSGSAAVPSTVSVFSNNSQVFSQEVAAGPFQVSDLPITTGPGMARIVVTDSAGQQIQQDVPFYSSAAMLAPGLSDFSLEAGFARNYFGTLSNEYDDRFVATGSIRHGLTNSLTLEGHAEAGGGLFNGGAGTVFNVGPYGIGAVALAGSLYDGSFGGQFSASFETGSDRWRFYASTQRTFGDYQDVASVTAPADELNPLLPLPTAKPPKALDQLSLSLPTGFDDTSVGINFSNLNYESDERYALLGLSYSRPLFANSTLSVSAYSDLANSGSYGVYAGLSVNLGSGLNSSVNAQTVGSQLSVGADISRQQGHSTGDYGWRIRDSEGSVQQRAAAVSYRAPFAQLQAGIQQLDNSMQFTAQADGAIALLGGGVFLARRIDDAFAVIDAGAPGIEVFHQNRSVGLTGSSGRILVPNLHSWTANEITIDPTKLPVDALVPSTQQKLTPTARTGTVVKFGASNDAAAAIVVLADAAGQPIEAGTEVRLDATSEVFVVGYDGEVYVTGLSPSNEMTIDLADGTSCQASFRYSPDSGQQVRIPDVSCQ